MLLILFNLFVKRRIVSLTQPPLAFVALQHSSIRHS